MEKAFLIKHSVIKAFKCSFPIYLAFKMSIRCSERTTQSETIFFRVDFFVVIMHQYLLFVYMLKKTYITFACVNPILFLIPFIIFIVLLPFSMNFRFNFRFEYSWIAKFHLVSFPLKKNCYACQNRSLKWKKYGRRSNKI